MKLEDFDFSLPSELIAQQPADPRDHARLLIYDRAKKSITDDFFYNLDKYLVAGSSLVMNNSKVEKCRLRFGSKEIFVLETINSTTVRALVRPGKRFTAGKTTELELADETLSVKTLSVDEDGIRTLKLGIPLDDHRLDAVRQIPLPPYIAPDESLGQQYQTVYAEPLGSKAAPTAGLHFTSSQLTALSASHALLKLTLHVGMGTFAKLHDSDLDKPLHEEFYEVDPSTADALNRSLSITAVGTTSLRVLETVSSVPRSFHSISGRTNIFIKPGYQFKAVDSLITNFHLPKSSLCILVAAFMGSTEEWHRVYAYAIAKRYRFYSFGDAMIIL